MQPKAVNYQNCKTAFIATISRLHKCTTHNALRCTLHILYIEQTAECGVGSITLLGFFSLLMSLFYPLGVQEEWLPDQKAMITFHVSYLHNLLALGSNICTDFAHTSHTFILCTYFAHTLHTLLIIAQLACSRFTHLQLVYAKLDKKLW